MKVLSLFSGIGSYEKALRNLKIDFELTNYCEINFRAALAYSLIHKESQDKNLVDIESIRPKDLENFDLLVYSPPCQDISTIGTHAGIKEGTRTGLMWKSVDIIKEKKPKYFVMENVRNLKTKYGAIFEEYIKTFNKIGYDCYDEILNAKDYGIPQNRKRLFIVGIRKDLKQKFEMPKKTSLTKTLRDFIDIGQEIKTIDKDISYTIRVGGRKSKVGNKHNWDGYIINGEEHYLTAKDCMLLMGFSKSDYNVLEPHMSEGAILKVAGNSVVVNVLEKIFKNLIPQ